MQKRPITALGLAVLLTAGLLISGCGAAKHFRSSKTVGLDKAPYIHGNIKSSTLGRVGHLPVVVDRSQHHLFDEAPWQAIAKDMTRYINSRNWTELMEPIDLGRTEAPELYVGDKDQGNYTISAMNDEEEPCMALHFTDPSYKWRAEAKAQCRARNLTHILYIQVGRSQYRIRQKDWKGNKELVLGTGYKKKVNWLSSLDDPIEVIQVSGALMDSTGHILRAGAEGILAAKSASLLESALGLSNSVGDKKMNKLTSEIRRKDLPGEPLAYEVALTNLVAQLLKKKEMLIK